jgi:tRNA dimethylallyltransferase
LEVIELSGRPMTELQAAGRGDLLPYQVLKLVRAPRDRKILHHRIEARFLRMLDEGFAEEVRQLMRLPGFSPELPSMRAVGYRQMISHLLGELTWDEMIEKGIIATRQLAKRQFTWLRTDRESNWLNEEEGVFVHQAEKIIVESLAIKYD